MEPQLAVPSSARSSSIPDRPVQRRPSEGSYAPRAVRQRVVAKPIIRLEDMSHHERERLGDALYPIHQRIFNGVGRAEFQRYVIDSSAERTILQTYVGEGRQLVGYTALHFFERTIGGRPATIIRSESGLEPAYRGRSIAGSFVIRELFKLLCTRPRQPVFAFACPVHPSSYYTVSRYAVESWPRWDAPTPESIADAMLALADEFALRTVDRERPMIREIGWQTRETCVDHEFWQAHENPHVRYYMDTNPEYRRGRGILMLIPVTLANLYSGAGKMLWRALCRRFRR